MTTSFRLDTLENLPQLLADLQAAKTSAPDGPGGLRVALSMPRAAARAVAAEVRSACSVATELCLPMVAMGDAPDAHTLFVSW